MRDDTYGQQRRLGLNNVARNIRKKKRTPGPSLLGSVRKQVKVGGDDTRRNSTCRYWSDPRKHPWKDNE